jgi:hypothetical protein
MKIKAAFKLAAAAVSVAAFLYIFTESPKAIEASDRPDKPHDLTSSLEDQEGISVTVYNSNIGLVKDRRRIRLASGLTDLKFTGVAAQIMPQTVQIKSLTDSGGLEVLEQNYQYDLLTPEKLLEKFVGQEIKVLKDGIEIPITILSTNNGLVYRMGGRILTDRGGYPGQFIFPSIPENLIPKPTLVWHLENRLNRSQEVEATYLTQGINWKADYVMVLDKDDRLADLTGWVTLDNKSGTSYRNAKLKLVAGDVNRVFDQYGYADAGRVLENVAAKAASPAFAEQSFFEYHLYTLGRPTTIKDNETKQVTLLASDRIPVTKQYLYYGAANYYRTPYGVPVSNQKVGVYVELANKKENRLGMPLPKGTIRVYKADADGSLQFAGEDRIDHTPKDEKIKIKIGDAFDVVAERKQTEWRKLADNLYEVAFEVSVRNHKDSPVTVSVIEPIPGDWDILQTSHEYEKVEAHTVRFDVPVKKDGKAVLTYRVRMRF